MLCNSKFGNADFNSYSLCVHSRFDLRFKQRVVYYTQPVNQMQVAQENPYYGQQAIPTPQYGQQAVAALQQHGQQAVAGVHQGPIAQPGQQQPVLPPPYAQPTGPLVAPNAATGRSMREIHKL